MGRFLLHLIFFKEVKEMILNKTNTEILVDLKDIAVGMAIVGEKKNINGDVRQEANVQLMTVLRKIGNCLSDK